ncbi:hypothetical protein Xcel_2512 [Xylanimonas cellulosilytica DSM 15894]|uniref:Uncharacterized protein n=1 Tax=Xylanimonas cellulosilytica (strain DSM 15894 / JCM 12276 / CECT 5975 / KCTC 9989 / LMG 20990 / NBRC 107835 / XIL07) TaxID=446471 RepID=D1BWI2_XYLCX|nr:LpqB family beta-propeller domain-containing protein [Xylanimonas cellulosilytica]ACZ31527.1 hypothetical protein Xcel_2512 [Xylanimonas cellulosilytica DSM 15894]
MSLRSRSRGAVAAALAAVLTGGALAGCAAMPVAGDVQRGGEEVVRGFDPGQIAFGPTVDAEPDAIVRGFLLAAQAGPSSPTAFSVAREFLTDRAAESWMPYSRVVVIDGVPQPALSPDSDPTSDRVVVQANGNVVASVDERGVFTDEPAGSTQETTFDLVRQDGQWRIARLDDGLMVPSPVFTTTFRVTTLYFPTPDHAAWVPDVRWFPQQTWRTNAVEELVAGPPAHLAGAASPVLPVGTGLAMSAVTQGTDGSFQVSLTDQISEASGPARGLFAAQLRATLADARGEADITLSDSTGPIVPPDVDVPERPRTPGMAVALRDGTLWNVTGRTLTQSELAVHLEGLDPTALAVNRSGDVVVVRDGETRLVRVTGEEPTELIEGLRLVAPSIDPNGAVWTGDTGGPLVVVTPAGDAVSLDVPWLEDRTVASVRVSPEGARVAVVSSGADGTSVHVAGILRDARGVPTALTVPVTVGASVQGVEQAVWQEESVLALLGQEIGGTVVFLAGVGGLAQSVGGLPRRIGGITDPVWLSAAVGSGDILAVDAEGVLHLRQSTAMWPVVGSGIELAAFAG